MPPLSPAYDNKIAQKYGPKTLEQKGQNKTVLQKELGWPEEPKRPMLCFPTGMSKELGGGLLKEILPGLLSLDLELLVLGKGEAEYGKLFTELSKENGHRIHIVPNKDEDIRKMYAAADMALFLTDPADLLELQNCLNFGVIPVAPKTKALENYDPVQEKGNSFLFEKQTMWHAFAALVRALETHVFPFDWRTIQRQCMESVRE